MKNIHASQGFAVGATIIIVILIGILGIGGYAYWKKMNTTTPVDTSLPITQSTTVRTSVTPPSQKVFASKCGLTVTSPAVGTNISFPLSISGVVDNNNAAKLGCSWVMFEGQLGTAQIFRLASGTWQPVSALVPVMLSGDWMNLGPVPFTLTMNITGATGLVAGTQIKIVFTEENPAGNPTFDTLEVPLVMQ